jgi:hypothetical protein
MTPQDYMEAQMSLCIKRKDGRTYHSAGDVLRDEIGDEWHSAHLGMSMLGDDHRIYYTEKGKHVPTFFSLKPNYTVTDTSSLPRDEVTRVLRELSELKSEDMESQEPGTVYVCKWADVERVLRGLTLNEAKEVTDGK